MAQVEVNVSVADDALEHFSNVVTACREAGLRVTQQLDAIGIISGTIEADRVTALERVPGVAHVERSREIRVPPPTSRIQ